MDWDLRETSLRCAACAKDFHEGQEVFSILSDTGAAFERNDYCAECGRSREQQPAYSRWRTTMPRRETPLNKRVNGQVVLDFFHRLEGEQERRKQCFRYVLGLMLMRKKLMKFGGVRRGDGGEELVLSDPHSGVEYRVYDPKISAEEISSLTEEVGKLLNVEFGARDDGAQ
jgi:hypothetical protein